MLQIQFCLYLHHVGFSQKANYFSALCKCKYWFLMRPVHLWNNFLLNCKKQTRKIRIYRFGIREPMSRTCCWHLPQNKRIFLHILPEIVHEIWFFFSFNSRTWDQLLSFWWLDFQSQLQLMLMIQERRVSDKEKFVSVAR